MRVLLVTDQYAPMVGGVPAVTGALARGLGERGHAVTLLVPSPGRRDVAEASGRVSVHGRRSVPWPWYAGMRLAYLPAAAACDLMAGLTPDVIHIHSPLPLGVMARPAAERLNIPVVYTNHYLPQNARPRQDRPSRIFDTAFYSYLLWFSNRCSHITAPTTTALGLLRDRGLRAPSSVVSNGIDLRTFAPGPAGQGVRDRYGIRGDRPVILSVGRLSREKAVDVLLDAAARLTGDAQVAIAGTGPDERRLKARARHLGLAGRVRFLGYIPGPDLPAVYRLADIYAITSPAELQSLTTMEAMATGLPVVAADAFALSELVRHDRNGFLVRPGHGDELAACLDRLLADPDLRGAMGRESLRAISAHEHGRSLTAWETLYGQLTSRGSR